MRDQGAVGDIASNPHTAERRTCLAHRVLVESQQRHLRAFGPERRADGTPDHTGAAVDNRHLTGERPLHRLGESGLFQAPIFKPEQFTLAIIGNGADWRISTSGRAEFISNASSRINRMLPNREGPAPCFKSAMHWSQLCSPP